MLTRGILTLSLQSGRVFEYIRIRFPGIGSTLEPYPAGVLPGGQAPAGVGPRRTYFDSPAPQGFFNYRIDMPVPVGFVGCLHYSGATTFQAGTAKDPICNYTPLAHQQ